ncbi:MAG: indolepyruvate ferredoxin oxidoreductase subunit alpha [Methanobacterium sp.]|uniref:indolepyruvate ferredoxin oxidoreductase subunit alpha n=1 Tax=Methanobacterium sp. TaxID=2164 RepID=UPI003D656E4D|nr:indolepyruvate ferredoxin oxidoreductase subunit alpha [Methanobacterium sp.]
MNLKSILTNKKDEKLFLLGNEATVRGALEAGVSVASTYPGTPSSEIGNVLSKIAKESGVYFEFSTNEKVALEVAAAAAASGLRSFTFMKHVGLNVASDSFMSIVYTGVNGGMIILSTDDPSMFSSQNEQDNRHYARIANIPMMEPSNPQEIKDLMKYGYELSEEFQIPVLMRTTTRVSHMRGIVEVGAVKTPKKTGYFNKDPRRFVPVPSSAREMHKSLVLKMEKIADVVNNSPLNQIFDNNGKIGIITSGSAFNYVMDVIDENNLPINVLKITLSYPFPEKRVLEFIDGLDNIIIAEEVDPVMEKEIFAVIGKNGLNKKVHGKLDGTLPLIFEYSPDIILEGLKKVIDINLDKKIAYEPEIPLPARPPTLCPGCPHRAAYYAVKKAGENLDLDVIYPTDIGCYTLGIESPYEIADYLLSMGSSIGTSCGFSRSTNQSIVSFIGDSTFFHAGIPPLINAVHNKDKFVLVILDNRTTAMTGGQPHPGIPVDGMGEVAPEISIEKIVEASGVEFLKVINPLNINNSQKIFEEALQFEGVAVIISKYPCMLIKGEKKRKHVVVGVDSDKCDNCMDCLRELTCPAIYLADDESVNINAAYCKGCTVCIQMCSKKAIGVKK